MKLNNKGFALTSIIYMLIVIFIMILVLVLSNLAQRKVILDKMKYDVKIKLNQGGILTNKNFARNVEYTNENTECQTVQCAIDELYRLSEEVEENEE